MSELGAGLESGLGLQNLTATEVNIIFNHKVHLMKIESSCNWTFRSL